MGTKAITSKRGILKKKEIFISHNIILVGISSYVFLPLVAEKLQEVSAPDYSVLFSLKDDLEIHHREKTPTRIAEEIAVVMKKRFFQDGKSTLWFTEAIMNQKKYTVELYYDHKVQKYRLVTARTGLRTHPAGTRIA